MRFLVCVCFIIFVSAGGDHTTHDESHRTSSDAASISGSAAEPSDQLKGTAARRGIVGDARDNGRPIRIMPLGDSISICCNYCAVPAGVLVRKELAEPPTPWDGYIRKLWHQLKDEERAQQKNPALPEAAKFKFTYVGRVVTCMVNRSESMRVPDDWDIRYEGYYGYPTSRVLHEIVRPAVAASDPDVVLLMLGTNDLIQARSGRVSRVGGAIQNLKAIISILLESPRVDGGSLGASRHVLIGKIPPIWFNQIKAVPPNARKPYRVTHLNTEIDKLVDGLVAAQRDRYLQIPGVSAADFVPTIRSVDMFTNVSAQTDLHGDGLHPNDAGELKLSSRWFAALTPIIKSPVAHTRRVPMAQNSDALLHEELAARGLMSRGPAASDRRIPLESSTRTQLGANDPVIFGEHPSTAVDASLMPFVLITVGLYLVAVCRPTQRWIRVGYTWVTSVLPSGGRGRPVPR